MGADMNNPPAFPLHNHGTQTLGLHITGMTLRDYFAAKALPAVYRWFEDTQLADNETSLELSVCEIDGTPSSDAMLVAEWSYGLADAMMKVRNGTA